MNLPQFAVRRPHTVLMIFLGIALIGVIALTKLKIDFLPEIEPPVISVLVPYPGASAADVESDVTKYLEDQLISVNNLDRLKSLSKDNLSLVSCIFDWGTNLDVASNDVRDKLDLARPDIREHAPDAEEPMIFKFSTATAPILFINVSATQSWKQLYHLADKDVADPLKRIPGVGAVVLYGGLRRQIRVSFDQRRLAGYGFTAAQIERVLASENVDLPAGDVKMGGREYQIRLTGRFKTPEEVGAVIVGARGGRLVRLRDVAEVKDSFEEPRMYASANGRKAVLLILQKQTGANTVLVSRAVRARLAEIQKHLPADVRIVIGLDTSEFILFSIRNLAKTLFAALVLVVVVTLLFLRRLRASLIVVLVIPFSLIICFIVLFLKGFTINVVSLMSVSIAIGMVVDNAIVVLENITRRVEEGGETPDEAAVFGAMEVGAAISASTLTTVVVFAPLIFVTGISGIVFKQLGLIVSITLLGSLFAALTLTPMLAARWIRPLQPERTGRFYRVGERALEALEQRYRRLLRAALRHRKKMLAVIAAFFLGSLGLLPFIGTDLFPDVDTGDIDIQLRLDESSRLEHTAQVAERVSDLFAKLVPETRARFTWCGETKKGIGVALGFEEAPNAGSASAKLISKRLRKRSAKEIAAALRQEVKKISGLEHVTIVATDPFKGIIMGGGKQVEVEIIGHDMAVTDRLAEQVRRIFERTPGAVDVSVSRKKPRQEIHVLVDREKAASLGVTTAAVGRALRTYYHGADAAKFRDAGDDFDIRVRLRRADRRSLDAIGLVEVPSLDPKVKSVKLENIARIKLAGGPVQIDRKNRERIVTVGADCYKRSLGEVRADVEKGLRQIQPPPGVTIDWGGQVEEQRKAFRDLTTLLVVGLILVYMVMVSQFESFKTPFVIAFSIPFAFTGVLWAFYLAGVTLSIMTFMAGVMLVGVVVNNAIVMVDYTNILRARGMSLEDALLNAGARRLRPVLMTTFTTLFGMLPLALSRGDGAEMWRPFGVTAIGGLSLSTLVTLLLAPIIYSFIAAAPMKQQRG